MELISRLHLLKLSYGVLKYTSRYRSDREPIDKIRRLEGEEIMSLRI